MINIKKHLSEPWFSLIKLGLKKYEGRLKKSDFLTLKKNDTITFFNNDFDYNREYTVKIIKIRYYDSFETLLKKKLRIILPGIDTIDEGIKVYRKYYSEEAEKQYGVLAIKMNVIN